MPNNVDQEPTGTRRRLLDAGFRVICNAVLMVFFGAAFGGGAGYMLAKGIALWSTLVVLGIVAAFSFAVFIDTSTPAWLSDTERKSLRKYLTWTSIVLWILSLSVIAGLLIFCPGYRNL